MSRVVKGLITLCGLIVLTATLCGVWFYERLATPSNELHSQLETMIATHDVAKMKTISLDNSTDQFLIGLPKNTSITASDFQGGGNPRPGIVIGYFPAQVGNQMLNCFMVADVSHPHFIPHWHLIKVSMKVVGIDPTWADSAS